MKIRSAAVFSTFSLLVALSSSAFAQTRFVPSQAGVIAPGRSIAGNDDASALSTNPANLGFLPAGEFRWTWVNTPQEARVEQRGHSFDMATPLLGGFSAGVRLDLVRPYRFDPAIKSSNATSDYEQLVFGFGFAASKSVSTGFSITSLMSDDTRYSGLVGLNAALTLRPNSFTSLSFVARSFNNDQNSVLVRQDRAYDVGLTLRPTARREVELGVEARYSEAAQDWIPKATLGVDIRYIGRLRGDISLPEPRDGTRTWQATAGLDINGLTGWNSSYYGGAVFGQQGPSGSSTNGWGGFYMGAAFRGYREPGLPTGDYGIKLRIESVPGDREHVKLLRAFWRVAQDPEVKAIALVLKAEPASSLAHAEELGDAIRMVRSRGKKVLCHLEDASGRALFVCSQADRIVANPAGGLRFSGIRSQYMFFGSALKKLGVRSEFVRIAEHKSAAEQFTESGPTKVADADHKELLNEIERTYYHDVGGGRKIPVDELKERIAKGPFLAKEAQAAGLIDSFAYDDEVDAVVREMVGHDIAVVQGSKAPVFKPKAADVTGDRPRVAVIYVDGDIVDGRSRRIPLVGVRLAGSYTIAQAIKDARENPLVKAIVLRVESPGGSTMASDVMWREVELCGEAKKPVVVSMGSVAASGGYYISSPGTKIFANRSTITGSIGIFYGKVDVDELTKKLGIGIATYKNNSRADIESLYRSLTDEEKEAIGQKIKGLYDVFVDRVSRGRSLTPAQVDAVARGKVWTGEQARERGLVDRLGGLREALEEARKLGDLPPDSPFSEGPEPPSSIIETLLELAGVIRATDGDDVMASGLVLPSAIREVAEGIAPLLAYEPGATMARLEFNWIP